MAYPIKARLPLLLFLGSVFLAMAYTSIGVCVKSCDFENEAPRYLACRARCKQMTNEKEPRDPRLPQKEHSPSAEEEREGRGSRYRPSRKDRKVIPLPKKHQQEEEEEEDEQEQQPQEKKQHNPYHLPSERFETSFQNQHGQIRVLQRFDNVSEQLSFLKYYRMVEFESRPGALIQPHHSDAEFLIVITGGRGIFTIALLNYKESFYVKQYDVLAVPPGAISYAVNIDTELSFRYIKLVLPVNEGGQFQNFYMSGNRTPYKVFSKKILQATLKTEYDKIQKLLFGMNQEDQQGQSSEEGVIVKLKRQQIKSLSLKARSFSSREDVPLPYGPFNLKSLRLRYSNDYGNLWEALPQHFRPLGPLGIGVFNLELNEGSLFMPHFNTRGIVMGYAYNGKGHLEMGSPIIANQTFSSEEDKSGSEQEDEEKQKEEEEEEEGQQQEEQQTEGQIQGLYSSLSKADAFVVPTGYPVAVTASKTRSLSVVGFILNAAVNERNFLGGGKDNVVLQIDREVAEATFAGPAEEVKRMFDNQKEAYFVNLEDEPSRERYSEESKRVRTLKDFI